MLPEIIPDLQDVRFGGIWRVSIKVILIWRYLFELFFSNQGSATKFMSDVAMMNAKNVIDLERMMLSKRKK